MSGNFKTRKQSIKEVYLIEIKSAADKIIGRVRKIMFVKMSVAPTISITRHPFRYATKKSVYDVKNLSMT